MDGDWTIGHAKQANARANRNLTMAQASVARHCPARKGVSMCTRRYENVTRIENHVSRPRLRLSGLRRQVCARLGRNGAQLQRSLAGPAAADEPHPFCYVFEITPHLELSLKPLGPRFEYWLRRKKIGPLPCPDRAGTARPG